LCQRFGEAGVSKVVIACQIQTLVAGKGVEILRQAGIEVETGVCEQQAAQLNQGF
jgi:diaminohydroxyphosphoribosylaminopyrimidine deaminase/5-amino-6-(5-phosphoribosylamino)uracil reductase